jgi:glutamate 5-kinase
VEGHFERGDPVEIVGPDGAVLGAALSGYRAAEAGAIAGHNSAEIAALLGYPGRAAMAHRDDLILWS